MKSRIQPHGNLYFLLFACIVSALIYLPVMHNAFLSDDYYSLYRIVVEKRVLYREIFRPFIDLSFYLNFFISGLDPFGYYVFNIVVHALAVFFLYKAVLFFLKYHHYGNGLAIAIASAVLFMVYPFHNEAVAWLTGRLSSMAALFALISICFALKIEEQPVKNYLLSLLFYFLSMCTYEAEVVLPAIICILLWKRTFGIARMAKLLAGYCVLLLAFLMIRLALSSEIFSNYGERVVSRNTILHLFDKFSKALGRVILPPMENSSLLLVLTIAAGLLLIITHYAFYRQNTGKAIRIYARLLVVFFCALIVPVLFGVSTRTSEGDRLLYFPSAFLCMLIPLLIAGLVSNTQFRWLIMVFIGGYFLFFLEKNNTHWRMASNAADEILSVAKQHPSKKKILINIPEENEGAFIFRNAFQKALQLHHIDTSKVAVSNYLGRLEYLQVKGDIHPRFGDQEIFIFPSARISSKKEKVKVLNTKSNNIVTCDQADCEVWFWNKSSMIPVKNETR